MRVVILAAGKSSRMFKDLGKNKCLLEINNVSLISKIINDVYDAKISDLTVVTGFKKHLIEYHLSKHNNKIPIEFLHNPEFETKDMMSSLILALEKYNDDIICLYSDIYFDPKILLDLSLIKATNEIIVPVNLNWQGVWNQRKKDLIGDCESLVHDKNYNLLEIGNKITDISKVMAQFMGIVYFPKKLKKKICDIYYDLANKDKKKIHTTKFLNILIQNKIKVKCIKFKSYWYEFDDMEDYENFKMN